jgi:hypothetical protein
MSIQSSLASLGGDTWASRKMVALWPWPAVVVGHHDNLVNADDYRCFTRLLKPGDFLLTNSRAYFLSNFFIARKNRTAFSHLAVYTGPVAGYRDQASGFIVKGKRLHPNDPCRKAGEFKRSVTHAISEGVVTEDLYDLMSHVDWIAAVRPWVTDTEQAAIVKAALDRVGLEYNFDFKPAGPPASYCTELGAYCLKEADLQPPGKAHSVTSLAGILMPVNRFKSEVWMADDFVMFKMICCSLSCNDPAFVRKSRVEAMRGAVKTACDALSFQRETSA